MGTVASAQSQRALVRVETTLVSPTLLMQAVAATRANSPIFHCSAMHRIGLRV